VSPKRPAPTVRASAPPRDTVHAVVTRSRGWYVAECLEVAVVTQGHTLDELVTNLREAVGLHLEGGMRHVMRGRLATDRAHLRDRPATRLMAGRPA